jgi:hypothetical protein
VDVIDVVKTPSCGCCSGWVEHLKAAGFATRVTNMDDLTELKAKHGIPARVQSCHTATVVGYVVEGHVPAADIQRLLRERPAVAGIAVPGMPIGSPGMEVANMRPQAFRTFTFDKQGQLTVFASHNQQ